MPTGARGSRGEGSTVWSCLIRLPGLEDGNLGRSLHQYSATEEVVANAMEEVLKQRSMKEEKEEDR